MCLAEASAPSAARVRRGLRLAAENTWEAIASKMEGHIADVFTAPTALPLGPLMTVADPHDEPPHVRMEIVGTVPPLARS